jgi:YesN/AraC family two-component response regulator
LTRKVLIIDDEKPTLAMFELFLEAYGFEVLTAEKGEEGIEVFKAEHPSIVFTDIKMPGIDGFEVLKRIKTISPGAVVIVITGHGDKELAKRALDLKATDFIHKPVQKEALDAALEKAEQVLENGLDL